MSDTNNVNANPEVTGDAKETAKAKKETAKATKKVYKFQSSNKFLSCTALGIQFVNGKAETEKIEVAKALAKIDGVTLIEE